MKQTILHENLPIIQVAESHILDLLYADKLAAPMLLTRLSNEVAVVSPDKLDDLSARLLKLGFTPKVVRQDNGR